MAPRLPLLLVACALLASKADAMQIGLACMAPTQPADAGEPFSRLTEIEFYVDRGNPLAAYTVPFVRLTSEADADGRTVNTYGVAGSKTVDASIVFAAETPLTFTLSEIGVMLTTLADDAEETAFMADSIPGIACWKVEVEVGP